MDSWIVQLFEDVQRSWLMVLLLSCGAVVHFIPPKATEIHLMNSIRRHSFLVPIFVGAYHDAAVCVNCRRLRRTARGCCALGHHEDGHAPRPPPIGTCEQHRLPACEDCARDWRVVRHTCDTHPHTHTHTHAHTHRHTATHTRT